MKSRRFKEREHICQITTSIGWLQSPRNLFFKDKVPYEEPYEENKLSRIYEIEKKCRED